MASLRFSVEDLLERKMITPERAVILKAELRAHNPQFSTHGRRARALETVDGKKISKPHRLVWEALGREWPGRAVLEYPPIQGRRYRIDIAFPFEPFPLAVEVDGFSVHGKHLADFKKDRQRQNMLSLAGWRILRFFPGEIYQDIDSIVAQVRQALSENK